MTSFVQIPIATLTSIGAELNQMSGQLRDQLGSAMPGAGLDPRDQARLLAAVEGFRSAWQTSLSTLIADIGKAGDVAGAISRLTQQTDSELAAALRPGDGGGAR